MWLRTCTVLIAVLACGVGALSGASAYAQEGGTIRGVVYHDLDGDGVRDAGEPGLPTRDVAREEGGQEVTGEDGAYLIDAGAGEHTLRVNLDQSVNTCVGTLGRGFSPLDRSWCVHITYPWRVTTPQPVTVDISPGQTIEVDFGLQPVDVVAVAGNVILEDDFAPPGTEIEAIADGQECGKATTDEEELSFRIEVFGAGERAGCARRGDQVHFTVGGVRAAETVRWQPFVDLPSFGDYLRIDLTAMEQHAWYWFHDTGEFISYEDASVQALVDGVVCGGAQVELGSGIEGSPATVRVVGFRKLIVPSDALRPGCGRAGAIVTFRVGGVVLATMPWLPGLQEINSDLPRVLPNDGSGGAEAGRGPIAGIIAVLLVAGLLALGTGALVARR